jgi:hypothetical protein
MIPTLASAPHDLQILKLHIIEATGLAKDALHIYVGLAVFIGVRLIWRWRGGWMLAWLAALSLALAIEWLDIRAEGQAGALQPDPAHWHDVWNTMLWPTVLLLVGRWLQPRPKPKAEPEPSGDLADESLEEPPTV